MVAPLIPLIASFGAQALGDEANREATLGGVQSGLTQQRMGTQFAEDILGEALALQEPFIQAGQAALPQATEFATGGGDFRASPIFEQRQSTGLDALLNSIQGNELSGFGADRFQSGLDVSEEASQPLRLQDLLSIGLGSSAAAGQQSGTLADLASRAALQGGNLGAAGVQSGFEQRQNVVNQGLSNLGGLPSFFEATRQPQQGNPFITRQNPLGLTPGQGL